MGEIKSLQHQVDEWIRTVGVRYFNELTNMAMLTEEVGKLPELLPEDMANSQKKNQIRVKTSVRNLQMFFCYFVPANQTGTDLQEAFNKK